MLPEYRGYGRSSGSPTQAGITEDLVRFYDMLAAREEVDEKKIVFHGRSLGGAVVCSLAAQRPAAGLILQSTFTRFTDMTAQYFVPSFLVLDPFDSLGVVGRFEGPVLVIHGRRDQLIPHSHGELLAQTASRGRLVSYDCGHNDCPLDWDAMWREVDALVDEAVGR